jgi:CRP-like cAMP-binding protein
MVYITTFKPGSSFGEIALLTKQRRTGTVVARENCHCMTLNRESFTQIMGAYNDYVVNNKLLFLSSFPFFSGIPKNRLLYLLHSIREMTLKHRQVVYEEGDQVDGFYLIKKGMVEHSKVVEIEPERAVRGIERINRQNIIK